MSQALAKLAREPDAFSDGPYYELAEKDIDGQWTTLIWPMIENFDFTRTLDLAAGHGRVSAKLQPLAKKLYTVDISQPAVDFCKKRFADCPNVVVFCNNGYDLDEIPSRSLSAVVSFDAMVHFDSDLVRAYIKSFARILQPGGRGFIHHSNTTDAPSGDFKKHPQWRNFMSRELFAHWCHKAGLVILDQKVIDWGIKDLDCMTVFENPPSNPAPLPHANFFSHLKRFGRRR
jgi:SAM-dependent methyltransferase